MVERTTIEATRQTDIARAAGLIADASRASILKALSDGRALSASLLAAEAGITPQTVSAHLTKLVDGNLVTVERVGRNRHYRLTGPEVSAALEALAIIAQPLPVTSLRESNRGKALRRSRTCYDHLAGMLGVALLRGMIDRGLLAGHDGSYDPRRAKRDRPAGYGHDVTYVLTPAGRDELAEFGVELDGLPAGRPAVRYCVDWSERQHHLSGALGAALTERLFALEWLRYGTAPRVVCITDAGGRGLRDRFGVELPD